MRTVMLIVGALVAGVVLMVWGFVFWTLSPLPKMAMQGDPELEPFVESLQQREVEAGVYYYPPDDKLADAPRGPFVEMFYVPDVEYMGTDVFLKGFIHFFGTALLAGMILRGLTESLGGYGSRVALVSMIGILSAFAIHFSNPIWFHYPWKFAFMVATYDIVMFLLIGLVMGAFVRPADKPKGP